MKLKLGKRGLAGASAMAGKCVAKEKLALQINVVKVRTTGWRNDRNY